MEIGFFLNNNNGSDTDMTVEPPFFFSNTPTFIYGGWEGYNSKHKHEYCHWDKYCSTQTKLEGSICIYNKLQLR